MSVIDNRIKYLISLEGELRNEVKQRISQRDGFATQFLIGCGTVLTLSFLEFPFASFLIWLMPLVTIFYSIQILYSYTIHDNLTRFLRKHIEPELSRLLEINQAYRQNYFWETRCSFDRNLVNSKYPGIRKGFFEKVIFVTPIVAFVIFILLGYLRTNEAGVRIYNNLTIWLGACLGLLLFEGIALYVALRFRKASNLERLGKRDYIDTSRRIYTDRAIFLDRDGTIIADKIQPKSPNEIEFFSDTIKILKSFQSKGYLLILLSNQDGIKSGKLSEKDFHLFNQCLLQKFKNEGIIIDAIYYSPHSKEENDFSFKPNPGMLYLASEDFRLDMQNCYFVGDQHTDYIAGIRAGVKSMYVSTGIYKSEYEAERKAFFETYKPKCYNSLTEVDKDIISLNN